MAYSDIVSVKKSGVGSVKAFIECPEEEATHWYISVGFEGETGSLYLPSKESANACMNAFVKPYERGDLDEKEE